MHERSLIFQYTLILLYLTFCFQLSENIISLKIRCKCRRGFYGRTCLKKRNRCKNKPCRNNGVCINKKNGSFRWVIVLNCKCIFAKYLTYIMLNQFHLKFRCKCVSGYKGSVCQTRIDYCEARPCQNGGQCTLGKPGSSPSFRCACRTGFDVSQVIIIDNRNLL